MRRRLDETLLNGWGLTGERFIRVSNIMKLPSRIRQQFDPLTILTVLFVAACLSEAKALSFEDGPEVGQSAPALKLAQWLQAPPEASMGWPTGKVVVLEFWSTECGPCVYYIPHLNELAEKFKDKPVQFIAVTDDEESVVRRFLKKTPINAWIGLGTEAGLGGETPYRVFAIPHTVIIDLHGRIAAITEPSTLNAGLIELCLADKPLPQPNEPGGDQVPGVVPGQYRISHRPLFQAMIRPSSPPRTNIVNAWNEDALTLQPGKLDEAISQVFRVKRTRVITEAELPREWYDFYITLPHDNKGLQRKERMEAVLAQVVEATFGLTVKREMRMMDVLILRTNASSTGKLAWSTNGTGHNYYFSGEVSGTDVSLTFLAQGLEHAVLLPVLDETGVTNQHSFDVIWDQKDHHPNPAGMIAAVKERLGLDLLPAKRSLEVVVVRKAQKPDGNGLNEEH